MCKYKENPLHKNVCHLEFMDLRFVSERKLQMIIYLILCMYFNFALGRKPRESVWKRESVIVVSTTNRTLSIGAGAKWLA